MAYIEPWFQQKCEQQDRFILALKKSRDLDVSHGF